MKRITQDKFRTILDLYIEESRINYNLALENLSVNHAEAVAQIGSEHGLRNKMDTYESQFKLRVEDELMDADRFVYVHDDITKALFRVEEWQYEQWCLLHNLNPETLELKYDLERDKDVV